MSSSCQGGRRRNGMQAPSAGAHSVQFMTNRFTLSGFYGDEMMGKSTGDEEKIESFFFDAKKGHKRYLASFGSKEHRIRRAFGECFALASES